jgi:hypothetical protein
MFGSEERKAKRAEKEFAKGMDYLARGRADLAQTRFQRAEKLGLDVKAQMREVASRDLETFKQRIERKKSSAVDDPQVMAPMKNNAARSVFDSRERMYPSDEATVGEGTTSRKSEIPEEMQTERGPQSGENRYEELQLCDGSVRAFAIKSGFTG